MRILYHHRLGSKDGQYVHVEEIVGSLRSLGHEVLVAGPGVLDDARFGDGSGLVASLKRRLPRSIYECAEMLHGALTTIRLVQQARIFRPHVIYERYSLHLPAGGWAARLLGLPLLLEVNAPLAEERARFSGLALPAIARASETRTWRAADAVLAVSGPLADKVTAAGVPSPKVHVVPNGVDLQRFVPAPDQASARAALGIPGSLVVGFTGFMREWHGLDRLVDWLAAGAPPWAVVCCVGDGPARAGLEQQAASLGVRDRLIITGVLPRDQMPRWVGAFDVAIQPDVVSYASPLKLLEYMAAGRAIVAPDRPNIRELLTDGVDALLVPPEELAMALDRVLQDDELRRRLGAAARATVARRNLTWTGNAARIVEIAQGLLGSTPRAA